VENKEIAWDDLLAKFSSDYEMTQADALKWLSERDSLQTVAEFLQTTQNVTKWGHHARTVLKSLDTWLQSQGVVVTERYCTLNNFVDGEYIPDELYKTRYLTLRTAGWNREDSREMLGLNTYLYYQMLKAWKIFDQRAEQEVLATWRR